MSRRRAGQLLIASRTLLDPNFAQTVVLLVQQDEDGVIGLILNRPLDITVADACDPSAEEAADVQEKLFQGGPCPGPLMVLHSNGLLGGCEVVPGVHFSTERDQIQVLMREQGESDSGTTGVVRYFAGYAGWSPGQLENEIEEGAWLLAPASAEQVFRVSPAAQWNTLNTHLTLGRWVDVTHLPEDPSAN